MSSAPLNPGRPIGQRFLKIQIVIVIVVTLITGAIAGVDAGFSALLGGLVGFLANAFVVYRVFRYAGAQNSSRILQSFFVAEAYKIGISALGLGLLFWSQNSLPRQCLSGILRPWRRTGAFRLFPEKQAVNKNLNSKMVKYV